MATKNNLIYLDHAATTLPHSEVISTYQKTNELYFANSSSIHSLGQKTAHLLEMARKQILQNFHVDDNELIFTSGATEAINLAIKGYCLANSNRGKHIITSNVEHPAVLESIKQLEQYFGFTVTYLQVNNKGIVEISHLKNAIQEDTILVSLMAVNNEIGSINPIHEISQIIKKHPKIVFHMDATQAVGKINIDYQDVDMFSYSAHKIHGLKNSGALIKKKNIKLLTMNSGGGHESGYRSGTVDVASSAALAKATRLINENIEYKNSYITQLATPIYQYLNAHPHLFKVHSNIDNPYIINFSFLNKKASVIVEALSNHNIMVSSVSACHSKAEAISHVIYAITKDQNLAHNTMRISLDMSNTMDEIKIFLDVLNTVIDEVR